MRPVRVLSFPTLPVLLVALAACAAGSPAATVDGGNGGEPSAPVASLAEPSTDGGGDGGDGGSGGSGGDAAGAEAVADSLAPPNGTESSRTTSGGLILVTYETADSVETLAGFYEKAMADAGLNVTSTSTTSDGAFWTFESGNLDGSVTLVEGGGTNNGTAVAVSVLDKSV